MKLSPLRTWENVWWLGPAKVKNGPKHSISHITVLRSSPSQAK